MSAQPNLLDYLTDARDRVLFAQTPMLMMPSHGTLAAVGLGRRRYIAAADGIYLQARTRILDLTLRIAAARFPFGVLSEQVVMPEGLIPRAMYEDIVVQAVHQAPYEWAGLIHWSDEDRRYVLTIPQIVECSERRIRYRTDGIDRSRLVLDIHSHGYGIGEFSPEDNQSDEFGIHFATVLGACHSADAVTATTRLVVDGHFFKLDWHPWQGP